MKLKAYNGGCRITEVEEKGLANIPGLRWWPDSKSATGSVDAAAVVAMRNRQEPPPAPLPEAPLQELKPYATRGMRGYQVQGVAWMADHLQREGAAILADDMGLGKTAQVLLTWELLGKPQMLVVCPASVRLTWLREAQLWVHEGASLVTTGQQAAALHNGSKLVVTSYELAQKLNNNYSPTMLVLDEAHLLRGRGAKRSRGLLALGQECNYRLALTGTPMWSRPRDLWMLLRILFPNYRFGTAEDFDFAYCGAFINAYGGKVNKGATRVDELRLRLKYVQLRRLKEDVADQLPALQRIVRWVPATVAATRACEAFHTRKLNAYEALDATLEAKLDAAVEAAVEAQKFLLFTWQKKHAHELWRRLNEADVPVYLVTGDMSQTERNEAIASAAKEGRSIVATLDSCGVGVDGLQKVASVGIFHALDYVPIKLAQAEARLHRLGQTLPVQWVYLALEDSADAFVIDTIVNKLDQWRGVMGRDSTAKLRDDIEAQEIAADSNAALKALYEAMDEQLADGTE